MKTFDIRRILSGFDSIKCDFQILNKEVNPMKSLLEGAINLISGFAGILLLVLAFSIISQPVKAGGCSQSPRCGIWNVDDYGCVNGCVCVSCREGIQTTCCYQEIGYCSSSFWPVVFRKCCLGNCN